MTTSHLAVREHKHPETAAFGVSIVIKALNEEAKIAACLESCVAALREVGGHGEIVLADSVSTDRTVAVAAAFPVRIVQFKHVSDRGCGAGVQLGFQHARGEFVFFVDGDMVVQPGFLPVALAELQADAGLGGVAGLLVDVAVRNAFDRHRVVKGVSTTARAERWLNGGGVYRRQAIEKAGGYAADRNLKGWEEAELGMRVRAAGFHLKRIDVPAVHHDGHSQGTLQLLRSLWRSGRAFASGVLLRQAMGHPWCKDALRMLVHPIVATLWWLVGLCAALLSWGSGSPAALLGWAVVTLAGVLLVVGVKRSASAGLMSIGLWHFWALGLLRGLLLRRVHPSERIESIVLHDGSPQQ